MMDEEILPRELCSPIARRGKWTAEEERYTEKIIFDFEHGTLDVSEGTTLRTWLSKVLNCDPMRITKKYTGNSSIGKRTFVPLVRSPENAIFIDMSQQDLRELRAVWVNKLILMEQWNNRKMNLMKAHMGLGGPYDPNGANPHGRFDPPGSGSMLTCPTPQAALMLHRQTSGEYPEHMGGMGDLSGLDTSMENFQEVSLRLILEPYVAAPSEMDYIIKWLKTLNYVLVNRTLSPADLEHSLFARSISLPALVAIYRSGCVAEHARLQQVHETIEAYLRQIGITFPAPDSPKTVFADAHNKAINNANAFANNPSSLASSEKSPVKPIGTTASDKGMVLPSLPRVASSGSTDSLRNNKIDESEDLSSTGKTQLLLSAAETSGPTSTSEVPSELNGGVGVYFNMRDHLQHHLSTQKVPLKTDKKAERVPVTSSVFGSKYNLLPYAPEPGSEALYQAEQQALAFAEQQARAHAAAQAQAQALAESYQYPRSKLDSVRASEQTVLNNGSGSGVSSANTSAATTAGSGADGDSEDAEDHLMQYHQALVHSLAAERNLKKSAAAAAKSHSAALMGNAGMELMGNSGSKSARVPAHLTGPTQPQKRRKLAEYTDMYMRAAYPQQFAPVNYPHPPSRMGGMTGMGGGGMGGSFDPSFAEHQMQALASAAGEDSAHMYPSHGMYGGGMGGMGLPRYGGGGGMDYSQGMYGRLPGYGSMMDGSAYAGLMRNAGPGNISTAGANGASGSEGGNAATTNAAATSAKTNPSNTASNATNSNIAAGMAYPPAQGSQFPPELLAMYMQQMYGGWSFGNGGSHNHVPNAQQLHQAQMMHFAESMQRQGQGQGAVGGAGGANRAPTGVNPSNASHADASTLSSNGNSGSGNTSGLNSLATKLTLDEYLKNMQQRGSGGQYPSYPVSHYSHPGSNMAGMSGMGGMGAMNSSASPEANHLMMMATLGDPRYIYSGDSSVYRDPSSYLAAHQQQSYGAGMSQQGGANTNPPASTGTAGKVHVAGDANVASGTANSSTANATSNSTGAGSTGEGDSEGKEKGHSAAAEALLTLLKK